MNISFINDEFSDNIEECVYFCRQNEIKFIEIRKIDGKDICEFSDSEIMKISNILEKNNIKVSCVDSRILKSEEFPFLTHKTKQETNCAFDRVIQVAKILKATNIRIFSGTKSPDFSFKKFALFLQEKNDFLDNAGVNLLLENEKNCNIATVADLKYFFENFSLSRIFPLIDFENAVRAGEKDVFTPYLLLKNKCNYYHFKDMNSENKRCAVGKGIFDFKLIKENANKSSFFSLEPGTKNKDDMEVSMQYMRDKF